MKAVFREKKGSQTNNEFRSNILQVAYLALLLMLFSSGLHAADYDGKNGPYTIKILSDLVITDQKRNRKIPIKIYYPDDPGPFPIILYSHGLGGSREGKKYLGKFWASHGYVGIFMTHFGSDRSLIDLTKSRQEIIQALREAARSLKAQLDRPRDVTSVIDSLIHLPDMVPQLKGKLDRARIGISGHSFGAFTTLVSAGAWADITRKKSNTVVLDNRPVAFLAMSPQAVRLGFDPKGVFAEINRPVMTMTGSKDTDPIRRELTGKDRLQPYQNMPPGDKYSLWLEGAHHWTFGDGRQNRIPDPKHHLYIKICSLAFWDAYLKESDSARQYLKSGTINKISAGSARLDYK